MGVNLDTPVLAGTENAKSLVLAWEQRQVELKAAMAAMMKPAEHLANLTHTLQIDTITQDERLQILIDLESLLSDIDNARDFYTIGSWPVLVQQLQHTQLDIQAAAAWAIGTTIKNHYDYQLWLLEPVALASNTTALALLLSLLDTTSTLPSIEYIELQKRVLYAISAALRGNLDLQTSVLHSDLPSSLYRMINHVDASPEVVRKIVALLADMMIEREYIVMHLVPSLRNTIQAERIAPSNSSSRQSVCIDSECVTSNQAQQALDSLEEIPLLADSFLDNMWLQSIAQVLETASQLLRMDLKSSSHRPASAGLFLSAKDRMAWSACLRSGLAFFHSISLQSPLTRSFPPWNEKLRAVVEQVLTWGDEGIPGHAQHAAQEEVIVLAEKLYQWLNR